MEEYLYFNICFYTIFIETGILTLLENYEINLLHKNKMETEINLFFILLLLNPIKKIIRQPVSLNINSW